MLFRLSQHRGLPQLAQCWHYAFSVSTVRLCAAFEIGLGKLTPCLRPHVPSSSKQLAEGTSAHSGAFFDPSVNRHQCPSRTPSCGRQDAPFAAAQQGRSRLPQGESGALLQEGELDGILGGFTADHSEFSVKEKLNYIERMRRSPASAAVCFL